MIARYSGHPLTEAILGQGGDIPPGGEIPPFFINLNTGGDIPPFSDLTVGTRGWYPPPGVKSPPFSKKYAYHVGIVCPYFHFLSILISSGPEPRLNFLPGQNVKGENKKKIKMFCFIVVAHVVV